MTRTSSFILTLLLASLVSSPAAAQDHGHATRTNDPKAASAPPVLPYAAMMDRRVKALSDRQVADLRAGRGMGLALPAELNGYPGPLHVLELADALQLSHEQRLRTTQLVGAMKAQTIPIGRRIVAEETRLDRLFAEKQIDQASLEDVTAKIGAAQGELRAAHLGYHLKIIELLSTDQIARYGQLRGYAGVSVHDATVP